MVLTIPFIVRTSLSLLIPAVFLLERGISDVVALKARSSRAVANEQRVLQTEESPEEVVNELWDKYATQENCDFVGDKCSRCTANGNGESWVCSEHCRWAGYFCNGGNGFRGAESRWRINDQRSAAQSGKSKGSGQGKGYYANTHLLQENAEAKQSNVVQGGKGQ